MFMDLFDLGTVHLAAGPLCPPLYHRLSYFVLSPLRDGGWGVILKYIKKLKAKTLEIVLISILGWGVK